MKQTENIIHLGKWLIIVSLTALSLTCPAPINGYTTGIKPPTMAQDSEHKLESEQSLQTVTGQVGNVPANTSQQSFNDGTTSQQAQGVLSQEVQKINSPKAQEEAKQVLAEAQSRSNPEHHSPMAGIFIFFGIGLLSVFGLKKWADTKIGGPGNFDHAR